MVELSRDHVVLRRAVSGIKMAIKVRTAAYLGIAIRIEPPQDSKGGAVAVMLEHRDPGLSLPLYRASDGTEIVAEWQSWGRALCLPLLIVDTDGRLREPFARIGAVRVAAPTWRRRRRSALRARRPTLSLRRRRVHKTATEPAVYREEREIIARN